jgi:hypothetical protein
LVLVYFLAEYEEVVKKADRRQFIEKSLLFPLKIEYPSLFWIGIRLSEFRILAIHQTGTGTLNISNWKQIPFARRTCSVLN